MTQEKTGKDVTRRAYLKYVGGAVAAAVVVGAGYGIYEATKPPPTPPTSTVTAPATTAAPTLTAPAEPIVVGVLMNLTGPWAGVDVPAWDGIQLAADQINAQGGLLGRPIKTPCVDTKADEGETVAATHRMIEVEKAVAIIGYCDTHWVLTSAPIAKEAGLPYITPGATLPLIPERTGAFLACFGDNVQAAAMAERAYTDRGLKKAVMWIDDACDYCVAVTTYFKDAFEHVGGEVVYSDHFVTSDTDFSAQAARLKSREKEVDCAYIGAIPDNCGVISKQIREGGTKIPILGEDGFDTDLLVKVGGEYAEGVEYTTHVSLESPDPKVQKFIADYKAKFGRGPANAFDPLGYDSLMLIAEAIKNTGSADPAAITSGLEAIRNFPGVTGSISFAPGQRVPTKAVSIIEVKDGKFVTVKTVTPTYIPPPELAA